MISKIVTLCLCILSVVSYSQEKGQKAIITLNDNRQIKGTLISKRHLLNFKAFNFKKNDNPEFTQYGINDARAIDFGTGRKFIRAIIEKCINCDDVEFFDTAFKANSTSGSNFLIRNTFFFSTVPDTVFLKVLVEGTVANLYSCIDDQGRDMYYFKYKDGPFTALKLITYEDYNQKTAEICFGPSDYQESFFYKSQLRSLANQGNPTRKLLDHIRTSLYSQTYLIPIFNSINEANGKITFRSKKNRIHPFTLFAGITTGSLSFSKLSNSTNQHSINLKNKFAFGSNAGIELSQNQILETGFLKEILLRFQLTYLYTSFGAVTSSDYHVATKYNFYTQNLTPSLQFLLGLYRNDIVSIYLGTSFDRPITLKGHFSPGYQTPAYYAPTFFNYSLVNGFKLLFKLNNKWEIDLSTARLSPLENFESSLSIFPRVFQLSFNHVIGL